MPESSCFILSGSHELGISKGMDVAWFSHWMRDDTGADPKRGRNPLCHKVRSIILNTQRLVKFIICFSAKLTDF